MTAKMKWKRRYTTRMLNTFFSELITQSKTAFSFGTRLIVFSGRNTRSTRSDFTVLSFSPPAVLFPLEREAERRKINFVALVYREREMVP